MPTVQELAERISWISESSTMKVAAEADRQRREGVDVVDFSAGEPDFPTPDNIKNAAIEALRQNFTKYTPVSGTVELKQTICDYHKRTYGTSYSPKECIGTIGGKHAIFNLVQALVDPGDEVIIPVPYWVTYKDVVHFAAGKCVFVDTDEQEGFVLSAAQVERHLTPKTKMIMLNSPCNPSGAVYERAEMEKIFRIAKDRGIWVMTDECYERFLYDSEPFSLASLPDAKETVVVAGSLSKTYAMTGWRMGFVLGSRGRGGGDQQAAEPHHVESDVHHAESGDRSAARAAGIGRHHAGRVSPAPGLRDRPAAQDAGREGAGASGRVLRVSERQRGVQERHHGLDGVFRKAAGRRARGRGSRGSVRDGGSYSPLLCDFDERAGARAGSYRAVR